MAKKFINLGDTPHDMQKQNLVTLKGGGDRLKCTRCGVQGIRRTLSNNMEISGNKDVIDKCKGVAEINIEKPKGGQVKVTHCQANGKEFAGLTAGSVHDVVDAPKEHAHLSGVWVMGATEPVRLLESEYQVV